jgi:hypothetical protein
MASINLLETESPTKNRRPLATEKLDDSVNPQLRDKQAAAQLYESAYAPKPGTEQRQDKACNNYGGSKDNYGDPAQYLSRYARPYNQFQPSGHGNYMHNPAYRGYAQQYMDSNCQSGTFQQPYTGYTQPYFGGYNQAFRGGYNQQNFNQPYGGYDQQGYNQNFGRYNQQFQRGFNQPYGGYDQQGYNQNFGRYNQQFQGGCNQPYGGYDQQGYNQNFGRYNQQFQGGYNQPFGGYGGYGGFNQPFGGYGGYGRGGYGMENMLRNQASNLLGSLPYMVGNNNDGCGGYNQGSFGGNLLRGGASSLLRQLPYMIGRSGNQGHHGYNNQFNRYR